jgi:glycerol-3-phosphate dehydrogenase
MPELEHIVIIGGGGVGGALAHDLALRGFRVTLVEKGELLSGTSGRHHGLLHSGARYVLHDPDAARECRQESQILRRIAPQAVEPNGGLFVALDDRDLSFREAFLDRCRSAGIPAEPIPVSQALAMEPALNPALRAAVKVPDAVMDAWRLPMHFFATAQAHGAAIRNFTEVTALRVTGRTVAGVGVMDHRTKTTATIAADLVVNAAGPWAGRIGAMAGIRLPIQPGPGVMVAVQGRLTQRVINRLQPAGEGDIIVPQRGLSILGTTAWVADDPDTVTVPPGHVPRLFDLCRALVPAVGDRKPHAIWSASRPLLQSGGAVDPYRMSRSFDCFDHGRRDGVEGLVTVIGGKATTMRAMAEKTADLICQKTGRKLPGRTRDTVLLPYRCFWRSISAAG